jgi:hypothetical protein
MRIISDNNIPFFHGGLLMNKEGNCTFQITGWDENTYQEITDVAKLSHAKVTQSYTGAIEGTSSIDYLMSYAVNGEASFVGMERVSGSLDGKNGTFVIQHMGTYSDGKARSSWSVVPGSGTGDLSALRGKGNYEAGHGEPAQVFFTYTFESDI